MRVMNETVHQTFHDGSIGRHVAFRGASYPCSRSGKLGVGCCLHHQHAARINDMEDAGCADRCKQQSDSRDGAEIQSAVGQGT